MSYHTPGHAEPLPQRLQAIALSLQQGSTNLKPFGAALERDGALIMLDTSRGPAAFWRRDLATIIANLCSPIPPPPVVLHVVRSRPAALFPLEKTWAYKSDAWPKKHKPGCAPVHAVGNFTTLEDAGRTLQFARENVLQARKSGNVKLIAVMEDTLERIQKRC